MKKEIVIGCLWGFIVAAILGAILIDDGYVSWPPFPTDHALTLPLSVPDATFIDHQVLINDSLLQEQVIAAQKVKLCSTLKAQGMLSADGSILKASTNRVESIQPYGRQPCVIDAKIFMSPFGR